MKKYNKLILNNLKCSFRNNIFIYLLFVVLILLSCIYLKNGVMHGKSVWAGDYYFNIIKGVEKIDSNNKLKEIPFYHLQQPWFHSEASLVQAAHRSVPEYSSYGQESQCVSSLNRGR